MNGAESLVQTLVNGGVDVCFLNPGTSEMYFVAATDKIKGLRNVLGLFEGVCTGAADGYARMAGKPAATLMHLGPGLGNGLANLHNARRANSPVVNIVGDHATYHLKHDAPLTTDIESIAKAVSGWVRTCKDGPSVPGDAAEAIAASQNPPGQVATLILPADCSWNKSTEPAIVPQIQKAAIVGQKVIDHIADVLKRGEPSIILLAGSSLMENGLWSAGRISRATGSRLISNRTNNRTQQGSGRTKFERLPYPVKPALKMLEKAAHLILVGAKPPVSFFAWRNMPNWLTPKGCQIHILARPEEDGVGALETLAEVLNAPAEPSAFYELNRPDPPTGDITIEKVWTSLAALMPENAIISDEGVTSSRDADRWMTGAPPHDWLNITGGAIGQGMPVATGAAVACPDRKVFSMQADGSGMYTIQALWTQAHEKLDVITVIFANRSYKILEREIEQIDIQGVSPKAREIFELRCPQLDWVKLAGGMGVAATRVKNAEQFNRQLEAAIYSPGPYLIEVVL